MTVFKVVTTDGYDYGYDLATFNLDSVRESTSSRLFESMQEAEILLGAYMDIAMEAPTTAAVVKAPATAAKASNKAVNGISNTASAATGKLRQAGTKVKDTVNKVVEFFKNLYKRFLDNMQTWFQNSGKWLDERKDDFAKFNYTELSTDMVPYWEGDINTSFKVTTNKIIDSLRYVFASSTSANEFLKIENYQQKYLKEYFDKDNNLKEGIKNYYRVNSAAGKDRVNIKGQALDRLVNGTFIPAILNYSKYVDSANIQLNTINAKLITVGADLDKRSIATESALFQEVFENTEFGLLEDLDWVLEETKPTNSNIKDSSDTSRTKVELNRDTRNSGQKAADEDNDKFSARVTSSNNTQVRALNNILSSQQLLVTSYLTVMEERYTVYMNALKAVWKASNNVGDRNKGVNDVEDTPAEPEVKTDTKAKKKKKNK